MSKLDLLGHEPRFVWGMFIFIPLLLVLLEPTGVTGIIIYSAGVWSLFSGPMLLVDEALPQLSAKYRHRLSIGLIVFVILILFLEGARFVLLH